MAVDLRVVDLRCESQVNPLGIDEPKPCLSWVLESEERGQRQTAYQVLAASSDTKLAAGEADLWDSGKVASDESIQIVYAGKPLAPGLRVHWKVRAWDRNGKPSVFAAPAWWEMALLAPDDWKARWITRELPAPATDADLYKEQPAPLFRKPFAIDKAVRRARAYVSGLGYYELRINGKRVGDHWLDPGWTDYRKRVLYSTYDVTSLLRNGENAVGAIVGNGWYNPLPLRMWGHINPREHLAIGSPRLIVQLDIEFTDGTRQSVVTDESWKVADSPILRNSIYLGEIYDARRETAGWDAPGFDAAKWAPVSLAKSDLGPLRAQSAPPIRATQTIKPVAIREPKPGTFVVDMGVNFAGLTTLNVRRPAGTTVKLRYGELLHDDGTLNEMTSVCGQIKKAGMGGPGAPDVAYQSDTYILKGDGEESYTPRFTFRGFRYVEITGFPGKPSLATITGHRLNSDVERDGSFACSNELFNRIQEIVLRTQLSNMFSVQSDCPHRERFGYGGDMVACGEAAMLNLDMSRFYAKTVEDLADSVRPNGGFTETAPFVGIADAGFGEGSGPIEWGTAHPWLLWRLYQHYGDKRIVERQYGAARRWMKLLESKAVEDIIANGLGDHETLVPKDIPVTGTAFYFYNARLMVKLAEVLGREAEAREYGQLSERIKAAFVRKFVDPATGRVGSGTQVNQAIALFMGLVPEAQRQAALDALVTDVLETHKGHLSTGIFGTRFMLMGLTHAGRPDVAYTIANQRTFPGWGHMLERGATTLWEHWEFSDNTFSHNHPMFGSVSEWFIKTIAGIQHNGAARGFDRIVIQPAIIGDLTWAKGEYKSVRGRVASEWKIDGGRLTLDVAIPVGATAVMHVPAKSPSDVTESGKPLSEARGVRFVRMENGAAVCNVVSGSYRFVAKRQP